MKSISVAVFIAAVACFAGTAAGQEVPDIEAPDLIVQLPDLSIPLSAWGPILVPSEVEPCFTLEETGQCGQDSIGASITCPDGSSGPGWVITAERVYKCITCPNGQGGRRKCNNTSGVAHMKLQSFGCPGASWGPIGNSLILKTCKAAELGGSDCEG